MRARVRPEWPRVRAQVRPEWSRMRAQKGPEGPGEGQSEGPEWPELDIKARQGPLGPVLWPVEGADR